MAEGPLKTPKLGTAAFLKAAGVRETSLPPLDMSRISQAGVGLGEYGNMVLPPREQQTVVWGAQFLLPAAGNSAAFTMMVKGAGTYIHWVYGTQNNWTIKTNRGNNVVALIGSTAITSVVTGQTPIDQGGTAGTVNDYHYGETPNVSLLPEFLSMRFNTNFVSPLPQGWFIEPGTQVLFARVQAAQPLEINCFVTEIPG